jgi:quercetin 2,3-dioxygenase
MSPLKKYISTLRSQGGHWVGDGFPVRTLFFYQQNGKALSPFLMLDYAGPYDFTPTTARRGVGEHPHRGFETVTIVYEGEVDHRDSAGGGGSIGAGDVQWMTAGRGVVHDEFHGKGFAARGGRFEMVQLWVNLPTVKKMTEPSYQAITDGQIPRVSLPEARGQLRVIAGQYADTRGPTRTHTPMCVWDLKLNGSTTPFTLDVPEGHSLLVCVLKGHVRMNGSESLNEAEVGLYDRAGGSVTIDNAEAATLLILTGEPLDEPIVGQGPFVMNTAQEIRQAIADYQQGKMGHLTPI